MTNPDKEKRYRERANRNWRALRKEQEQLGFIGDGGGKRYLTGIYYVLAGELEKAGEYFSWFDAEFPDDIGEPVFLLCWALTVHESGNPEEARYRFQLAMLSNLYLVPYLVGKPIPEFDIWHGSNWSQPDYLSEIEDWLVDFPQEGFPWLESEYEARDSSQLRWEYVKTYHALKFAEELDERQRLLNNWYDYAEKRLGKIG